MSMTKSVRGVAVLLTSMAMLGCSGTEEPVGGTGGSSTGAAGSGASAAGTSTGGNSTGGNSTGGSPTAGASTGGSSSSTAGSGGAGAGTGGTATAGSGGTSGGGSAGTGGSAGSSSGGSGGSSSGGSAGAGGQSGSAGAGGQGGGAKPSMGCGTATTQAADQWVESDVMSGGTTRRYSVRLPSNYKPMKAYPVVVLLHGCSSGTNNVPMEKATGADAILIRGTGSAASTCWDAAANGKDVPYFDAMVADVKKRFCTDESKFFAVGYSSGSWLVNQLTCIRADVLRGGATVTGGESSSGQCGGPVARIFIHDSDDMDNQISGSVRARDRQLKQNGCDSPAVSKDVDPSPCKLYQGCDTGYPVEWCQTSGQKHNRQDTLAPTTFWNFFKSL
jgi:poly(3-hydroxybutyrate) depolymerase